MSAAPPPAVVAGPPPTASLGPLSYLPGFDQPWGNVTLENVGLSVDMQRGPLHAIYRKSHGSTAEARQLGDVGLRVLRGDGAEPAAWREHLRGIHGSVKSEVEGKSTLCGQPAEKRIIQFEPSPKGITSDDRKGAIVFVSLAAVRKGTWLRLVYSTRESERERFKAGEDRFFSSARCADER